MPIRWSRGIERKCRCPLTRAKCSLIVNLARNSNFSDQVAALDKVYRTYKDQGLVVIGIPANDFGAEEPGTDAEVAKAYADLHLAFPVMARASVRGKDQIPLYGYLTSNKDKSLGGDVHWNFTKFVVDRGGQVVARFAPDVDPASPQVKMTIEKVMAGTFKKPGADKDEGQPGDDDDDE